MHMLCRTTDFYNMRPNDTLTIRLKQVSFLSFIRSVFRLKCHVHSLHAKGSCGYSRLDPILLGVYI